MSKLIYNYLPEFGSLFRNWKRPSMVTINLTRRCNQKCIYCEIGIHSQPVKKDRLTLADIRWLLDQMAIYKIPRISLCGGEPFLFDGIIDIVEYADKNKIRCSITSNGMIVHKLNENELNTLKKYNAEINISIDSFNENIQTFTRGNSLALQNALKSIKKLFEKKILLIWDGASYHRFSEMKEYLLLINKNLPSEEWKITCELFAPNAPEQNPVEDIWLQGKTNLRKFFAENKTFAQVKKAFNSFFQDRQFDFPKIQMYREFILYLKSARLVKKKSEKSVK